jgi:uncharacterized membrane protein HdeD (DUF308 family)
MDGGELIRAAARRQVFCNKFVRRLRRARICKPKQHERHCRYSQSPVHVEIPRQNSRPRPGGESAKSPMTVEASTLERPAKAIAISVNVFAESGFDSTLEPCRPLKAALPWRGSSMSATLNQGLFHGRLRTSANHIMWLGIAMAVVGIAAIVFPIFSTLVAALLVGWIFLISGIFLFVGSFSIHGTGPFFGALLLSLLSIAAGVFLLFNPLAGEVALTLVVGILFMIQGAFEIGFAFETRPHRGWVGMLISGIASVVLAILIATGWPGVSAIALGILLGVNLLSTGIGYISVSQSLKTST